MPTYPPSCNLQFGRQYFGFWYEMKIHTLKSFIRFLAAIAGLFFFYFIQFLDFVPSIPVRLDSVQYPKDFVQYLKVIENLTSV